MNRDFKTYFSFSKNYNPMVAMTGGSGTEIKLVSNFKIKNINKIKLLESSF
jgi:hypothetical protein